MKVLLESKVFWVAVGILVVLLGVAIWLKTGSFEAFVLSLLGPVGGPSAAAHFQGKAQTERDRLEADRLRELKVRRLEDEELRRKLLEAETSPLPPEPPVGASPEFTELSGVLESLEEEDV